MKKIIPAVFFQKKANGPTTLSQRPARLELFESELLAVTGGRMADDDWDPIIQTGCEAGGVFTFDDCGS